METVGVIAHPPRTLHGRRIAIAGGGTGGHVQPAIAVAEAYRAAVPDVDVLFLGTPTGAESRLVPAHGYRLATVTAAPFFGVGPVARLRSVTALAAGAAQARRVLRAERVELILGLGNFASAGAVLGARMLGLPTLIHEANAVAGVANRLLGRLVDRVLLGFADAAPAFPRGATLTGTPVRAALRALAASREPRAPGATRLLVLGGSQGSPFLNARVPEVAGRVARRGLAVEVWHQTGRGDPDPVHAAYQRNGVSARVVSSLDDITDAYRWADRRDRVCRCGHAGRAGRRCPPGAAGATLDGGARPSARERARLRRRHRRVVDDRGCLGWDPGRGAAGRAGGVAGRATDRGGPDRGSGQAGRGGRCGGCLRVPVAVGRPQVLTAHLGLRARSHRAVTAMASAAAPTAAIVAGRPAVTARTAMTPHAAHTP